MNVTLDRLLVSGIVAVIRRIEPAKVEPLVKSLIDGGVSGIEITIDSENACEKITEMKEKYGKDTVIGAGTVLNKDQAKQAIDAGAEFIFSPILDKETVEYTKEQGKIMIPGVFSPSEVYQGYTWGADIVKVFPGNILGIQYIKDLKGPLPHINIMPTGGINLNNVSDYIKAGSVAVGVGGSLIDKQLMEENKWNEITSLAREFVLKVQQSR